MLDESSECVIPWEVLQSPGEVLEIGVYGVQAKVEKSNTNGNVKINGSEIVVYTLPGDVVRGSIASGSEVSEMLNEVFAAQVQE